MFNYLFPKIDTANKEIWKLVSDYKKNKFLVHDEVCYICNKNSKNFRIHTFCDNNVKQLVTCFYYTDEIKKYILAFKYYHKKELIDEFWYLMSIFYNLYFSDFKKEETLISFVPMHWIRKYFIKWYNQWELLAKSLWSYLNIKVTKIWKKTRYTKPQAKISKRNKRLENLKWSFSCNFVIPSNIKNLIIIDDIITTGSTIKEFAFEVKKNNPELNIVAIVLARK